MDEHFCKFKVLSISDMISFYPNLEKDNTEIIVITKDNRYKYNFTPLLQLDFDDFLKEDYSKMDEELRKKFNLIEQRHVDKIVEKLPEIKNARQVFVCCDAGLSRSPAVAQALAHFFGDAISYGNLMWKHPFANKDVFEMTLLGLQGYTRKLMESE